MAGKIFASGTVGSCSVYNVSVQDRREGLWGVSKKVYNGNPHNNYVIARANIRKYPSLQSDPDLIKPGWSLSIPCRGNLPAVAKKSQAPRAVIPTPYVSEEEIIKIVPKPNFVLELQKKERIEVPDLKLELANFKINFKARSFPEPVELEAGRRLEPNMQVAEIKFEPAFSYTGLKAKAKTEKTEAVGQKGGNMFGKIFGAAKWPFKKLANRRVARVALMAFAFAPVPGAQYVSHGGLVATGFAQQGPKTTPVSVASKKKLAVPTLQEVEAGGNRPYSRYSVVGELKLRPNSIFSQPSYEKNKKEVEGMSRELASNVGLAGATVINEWPGKDMSPEVVLSADAVIIGLKEGDGFLPLYLADCEYKGKPWANRIKVVNLPEPSKVAEKEEPKKEIPPPLVPQTQPQTVTATPVKVNMPAFPSSISLNLVGYPTNTTQHVVYSGKVVNEQILVTKCGDWTCKFKNVGDGLMRIGIGAGATMFGKGVMDLPNAWQKVAKTNASGRVEAAKSRVPDVVNITNTNSSASSASSDAANSGITANSASNSTGGNVGSVSASTGPVESNSQATGTGTGTGGNVVDSGNSASSSLSGSNAVVADSGNSNSNSASTAEANPIATAEANPVATADSNSTSGSDSVSNISDVTMNPSAVSDSVSGADANSDANADASSQSDNNPTPTP